MLEVTRDEGINTYTISAAKAAEGLAFIAGMNAAFMQMTFAFDWSLVSAGSNVIDLGGNPGVTEQIANHQDGSAMAEAAKVQIAQAPITYTVIAGPMVTVVNPIEDPSALGAAGVTPGGQSLGVRADLNMMGGPLSSAVDGAQSQSSSPQNANVALAA